MLRTTATRAAYRLQHAAVRLPILAAQELLRVTALRQPRPDAVGLAKAQERYYALLERDLENAERGLYPKSLLALPMTEYAKQTPRLLLEVGRVLRRMSAKDFRDLPEDVDLGRYPHYFRRTFHWQTDGYFSRRSAEAYDVGVEFIFLGAADVMRRQIIPPVAEYLAGRRGRAEILDVACGTGSALHQLARALPEHRYVGLDLSPFYIEVAKERSPDGADIAYVAANGEAIPFDSGRFDAVTSVFLFHELPRRARRNVFAEMHRVLKPGGLLVIQDSAQASESPELASFQTRFAQDLHEPFFPDYVNDDLAPALSEAGFEVKSVEPWFVSKVVVAKRR